MTVYRIAKSSVRAQDLSGIGAFKYGGRWNNKGSYMLYASINSSLAYLENVVHFDESGSPPYLYITTIEIKDNHLIYELPDADYPGSWRQPDNPDNKAMGDQWIAENKFLAFKVSSAINPDEFNLLLNPLYPGYNDRVIVNSIHQLKNDARLIG